MSVLVTRSALRSVLVTPGAFLFYLFKQMHLRCRHY